MQKINSKKQQKASSLLEIMFASLTFLMIVGGTMQFFSRQQAAEKTAVSLLAQHNIFLQLSQKIQNRAIVQSLLNSHDTRLSNCLRSISCQGITNTDRFPFSLRLNNEVLTGTEGCLERLYQRDGSFCTPAMGRYPPPGCPISVTSSVSLDIRPTAKRPRYLYVNLNVHYCEPGGPCNAQSRKTLTSQDIGDISIGIEHFILADCSSLDYLKESSPDSKDVGQRTAISPYDRTFFFSFNEGYMEDFPSVKDRNFDIYCRKLRVNHKQTYPHK